MRSRFLLAPLLALSCTAGATSLDFGASYGTLDGALLRVGVTDYALAGFTLGAGVSSRGIDASVSRAFVLTGLGAARARVGGALLYGGGLSGSLDLSGTVGPVALTFGASAWNAAPDDFDPLARWAQTAPDLRPSGSAFTLSARYRLSRDVVLNAGGTLGAQNSASVVAEFRQEALTYRLGLRAGESVLGVSAGVGYTDPDSGLSAALDVLAGPSTLGLSGNVSLDGALGDGSTLLAYAAYEPWRVQSQTLRAGVQASVQAGPGTLTVDGRGGWSDMTGAGFGVRLGYTLPLDAPADDAGSAPATP